jgi:nudix-type nucleoside diphosphatase (YffH/AdpP family)
MKVEIISSRRVFDGFFKLEEAAIRFEKWDSSMSDVVTRLHLERGDSAAAIIWNVDRGRIVLVNQFKYPTYAKGPGWITETVAGMVEPGESPEDAVLREIWEEAGYKIEIGSTTPIGTFYVSPGGSSERIFLYYVEVRDADKIGTGGGLAQEQEDIRLLEVSIEEAKNAVSRFAIQDAKTLVGLFWLFEKLSGGQ